MSAFIVSTETMHRAVEAALSTVYATENGGDWLGRKLFALNGDAIFARYGERDPVPEDYVYQCRQASDAAMFRALACLLYQCSEGDVPERKAYRMLQAVERALIQRLTGHPELNESTRAMAWRMSDNEPWDYPDGD